MTHTAKGLSIFGSPKGFSSNLSIFCCSIITVAGNIGFELESVVFGKCLLIESHERWQF